MFSHQEKIDFSKYLLEQENFKIFFPFEMPGHFTKEGYERNEVITRQNYARG